MALSAWFARQFELAAKRNSKLPLNDPLSLRSLVADAFGETSLWSGCLTIAGLFFFLHHQTGLATTIAMTLTMAMLMLVGVQTKHRFGCWTWVNWFTIFTATSSVFFTAELLTRTTWCTQFPTPRFFLVMAIVLSVWSLIASLATGGLSYFRSVRKFVTFTPRIETTVARLLVASLFLFFLIALAESSRLELFSNTTRDWYSLQAEWWWCYAALGGLATTLVVLIFKEPSYANGIGLVIVWFIAWAFGAEYFESARATGTGMRWLLPIGGAMGAAVVGSRRVLIPAWISARRQFGQSEPDTWPAQTTQWMINFALTFVAVVVLTISTIAITQFIMNGGVEALGGPLKQTLFGDMKKDVSYGLPVGIMVGTFLMYAISERRKWLATAGSAVFQYCVLLSVVLLFLSPHPKLASSWFVNILQAVSVGMTGYGFVWYFFRNRIEGVGDQSAPGLTTKRLAQIEVHTMINGVLVTSLAVLVIVRFYRLPTISADWINSVGSLPGVAAWAIFGGLAYTIWRAKLNQPHRTSTWMWLVGWMILVLVGMIAAYIDRRMAMKENTIPWLVFNWIMWGTAIVCALQVCMLWLERRPERVPEMFSNRSSIRFDSMRNDQSLPLLFVGTILVAFAVRGLYLNPAGFWGYQAALMTLIICVVIAGLMRQSPWLAFVSAGIMTVASALSAKFDPTGWLSTGDADKIHVVPIGLMFVALVWSGYYIWKSRLLGRMNTESELRSEVSTRLAQSPADTNSSAPLRPSMVWMSNLILAFVSIWLLLACMGQNLISFGTPLRSIMWTPAGMILLLLFVGLGGLHLWNASRKAWAMSGWFGLLALVFLLASLATFRSDEIRVGTNLLALGLVPLVCGWIWANQNRLGKVLTTVQVPNPSQLKRSIERQWPLLNMLLGILITSAAFLATFSADERVARYLAAFSPVGVAIGAGLLSRNRSRRTMQQIALSVLTIAAMLFAWADLAPEIISEQPSRIFIRALLVLAAAMFFFGGFVSRWVRPNDSWLQSIREMTVATCVFALICFVIVVSFEISSFVPDVGCSTTLAEAIAVVAVALGMTTGLVMIAVLPVNDPFSLGLTGRMIYVYVAQSVLVLMVVHMYVTMPFLFQLGIKHYWPYLAMILAFAGVGIANLLEKRNLLVLAQPLFNTAAILPVAVAICIWGVDSRADFSLVMLTVGLAYLMISYTRNSILSGILAILAGNLALWLFYDKFPGLSFLDRPQMWLIPPALSVLVAAQVSRSRLSRQQLGSIRYICMTVIYLSSTSEIFINGLGQKLWPPMVLACLSVAGILAGMLLQIRAYLYLGTMFLLMSMISMVSHAHQRLEHVWPWWAFGITLGIAILVMFGLFEKRKNDMKQVVGRLREWDL